MIELKVNALVEIRVNGKWIQGVIKHKGATYVTVRTMDNSERFDIKLGEGNLRVTL